MKSFSISSYLYVISLYIYTLTLRWTCLVIRGRPIVWSILGRVTPRHLLTPIARLWVALEARLRLSVRRGHVRLLVDIHFQFSSCLNLKTRKEHSV